MTRLVAASVFAGMLGAGVSASAPARLFPVEAPPVPRSGAQVRADAAPPVGGAQDPAPSADVLIVHPNVSPFARDGSFPLVVGLHADGSSPLRLKSAFEHVAHQVRVEVALPRGPLASGEGFSWGSLESAESLVFSAAESTRGRSLVGPGSDLVLAGFSEGATLACAIALRHPDRVTGVVAVGPSLGAPPAGIPPGSKRLPRIAVLCTEGDPGVERCQGTARLLEGLGHKVDSRLLNAKQASAGLDRLKEALYSVLYGRKMF